jgi:hypothetical protein
MAFSKEDKHVIKCLRQTKQFGARRLLAMFPNKGWTRRGLENLIRKIDATGTFERRLGSGRPKTARTDEKIEQVEALTLSQEDAPQTHSSQRQIARQTGISLASVNAIIKRDLRLKCLKKRRGQELTEANKLARRTRCRQLLKRYPKHMVNFIWFTDEKLFTVAVPSNSQNDRVYAGVDTRKRDIPACRLLRTRPTFSKSVMVSVGVSALGRTSLHVVDAGVKINGQYYRDVLLMRDLLPDIRHFSDFYTFQQDGAPAHRARETVDLLRRETPDLIEPTLWPPNSPDLNPVDYKIWGVLQERVYREKIQDVDELRHRIQQEWERLDQRIIDDAVRQWRTRLSACVAAGGGHFEHKLHKR